ncbi:flavodoxin family protein [Egbenema bharatensis]|uniref:flavodoxin family protein n=1 Tax=Egbenema bharatensis TaxID=3463334 RepID=UPI003A8979F4
MHTIAIVYFSGFGHTHLMAQSIAAGAKQLTNTIAKLIRITGEQIIEGRWHDDTILMTLNEADAIIFGSPTYMGGVAGEFKAFLDGASQVWLQQGWKDKLAGGFTHSGSPAGDNQSTLLYLAINAAQHGMIWVSSGELPMQSNGVNRLGSSLGAIGQTTPDFTQEASLDSGDRLTAHHYGHRIATAAHRWHNR